MVAYDPTRPPDPARTPSPELVARLRTALAAQWESGEHESTETRAAIREIAREAKERRVPPETLIVTLKSIDDDVLRRMRPHNLISRRQLTEWLVMTCVRAYYEDEPG